MSWLFNSNFSESEPDSLETTSSSSPPPQGLIGMRNDLAEIGESLKSGLSVLSRNKAVAGISKLVCLFQFLNDEEEEEEERSGDVADDLVDFATKVSSRPEYWTHFPFELDQDFEMSDSQREHVFSIQHLVPSLAALRVKLHSLMRDEKFWMIYFIFLHPRLNRHDSKLLSTPKIVAVREMILQKLENMNAQETDAFQDGKNQFQEKDAFTEIAIEENVNIKEWKQIVLEDASFSDVPIRVSLLKLPEDASEWVLLDTSFQRLGGHSVSREKDSDDWLKVDFD